MSTYYPDCWVLCRIESNVDPGESGHDHFHYRVLAGWYGGYTGGDSWKLSSGLENNVTVNEDGAYVLPQTSGSIYIAYPTAYRTSGYTQSVANRFIEDAQNSNGELKFDVLSENEAFGLLARVISGETDV